MSGIDYTILAIIGLSTLLGLWRGLVREALSLAVWGLAFGLAYALASYVEFYFAGFIDDPSARLVAAFVAIFIVVHVIGFFVARLTSTLLKTVGLKGVDRVAGGGFGLARGVVIVAVLVLIFGMTPAVEEPLWQQSMMIDYFVQTLGWLQSNYPLELTEILSEVASYEL